jgi:hypothetical protein
VNGSVKRSVAGLLGAAALTLAAIAPSVHTVAGIRWTAPSHARHVTTRGLR